MFNLIATVTLILSWVSIGILASRIYKRQQNKPKLWKIIIVIIVGIFCFSINWNSSTILFKIPILPLGVWILYFILKRKEGRWASYRSFAWLGFWANFIFLAASLVTLLVHPLIYPKNELPTYISNVDEASIITIHPSAKNLQLDKKRLVEQLGSVKEAEIYAMQWYQDTYMEGNPKNKERFPYLLVGTSTKWGSGIETVIYLEDDGKGILIATPQDQIYFRSEVSILEGVE